MTWRWHAWESVGGVTRGAGRARVLLGVTPLVGALALLVDSEPAPRPARWAATWSAPEQLAPCGASGAGGAGVPVGWEAASGAPERSALISTITSAASAIDPAATSREPAASPSPSAAGWPPALAARRAHSDAPAPLAPARRVVRARVVDDRTGVPVPGADVRLREGRPAPDAPEVRAVTDQAGEAVLEAPFGDALFVDAEGFAAAALSVWLQPGQGVHLVRLRPALRLSGRVVDGRGRPIATEVTVELAVPDQACDWEALGDLIAERRTRSGPDGRFELDRIPAGSAGPLHAEVWLTCGGDGWWETTRQVEIGPGCPSVVEVVLARSTTLSGVVQGTAGEAIAGAAVWVHGDGPARLSGEHDGPGAIVYDEGARTDAGGRFSLLGPERGHLVVKAAGFAPEVHAVTAGVQRIVLSPAGEPIEGLAPARDTVWARSTDATGAPRTYRAQVGPDGRFRFTALPQGRYDLETWPRAGRDAAVVRGVRSGTSGVSLVGPAPIPPLPSDDPRDDAVTGWLEVEVVDWPDAPVHWLDVILLDPSLGEERSGQHSPGRPDLVWSARCGEGRARVRLVANLRYPEPGVRLAPREVDVVVGATTRIRVDLRAELARATR